VTSLADKVLALHRSLEDATLPHAFGGALALAWCTRQPRATSDIDLNVFATTSATRRVLDSLPSDVVATRTNATELRRDGQSRLWWDTTPVDVFLSTDLFHDQALERVSFEPFAGELVPFLSCADVAVFKAFFDRRRDWADIEDMLVARTIDADFVVAVLADRLGSDDARISKLRAIQGEVG
jgi:hypothetical protein